MATLPWKVALFVTLLGGLVWADPQRAERRRGPAGSGASAPEGTWLGQDGHDLVGPSPEPAGNGIQDVHIALVGLPLRKQVEFAVVKGLGGDEWHYRGPRNSWLAALVRKPGSSTADLFIDPCRVETGRGFEIHLRFDDGQTAEFWVKGGKADPNLRTATATMRGRWAGQVEQDWTGAGPSVGPDGIQDIRIELSNLSPKLEVKSVVASGPAGVVAESGPNPQGHDNAELVRTGEDRTKANLFLNPGRDLNGKALKLTLTYADGKTDSATVRCGRSDPRLRMPTPPTPRLTFLNLAARWLGQDGSHVTGIGDVHVALERLPAGRPVVAAALSNSARGTWLYRRDDRVTFDSDPYPLPLSLVPREGSSQAELYFPPQRDEAGGMMTLRLLFEDGETVLTQFPGGPCDPARRSPDLPAGVVTAGPGDDLAALAARAGTVKLARGTYPMKRPLILDRPVTVTGDPGATLLFSQAPEEPSWTTAIKIHCGHTTLEGFTIRFAGPIRWNNEVSYGPAVIGTTDSLDQGHEDPKAGIVLSRLDIEGPVAARPGTWQEAVRLARLVSASSGRIAKNSLRGGVIELVKGPWEIVENEFLGVPPWTFSPAVFSVHQSHDLIIRGNRARPIEASGKTWRFLVMTQGGTGDVIRENTVEGIGPRDGDTIPSMNSPEVVLTESYRLHFEGKPSALSHDGRVLQIPGHQGDPPQTGDTVALLSGPEAGQWRRVVQALGPTTLLLDRPIRKGDVTLSITTGFVNETFQGNTIDCRGGSVTANMVLAGNHFGTRVIDNRLVGGGEALRVTAAASEHPLHWGWSHAPFLGGLFERNTIVDSLRGATLCVEHGPANKSNRGRVYMSLTLKDNALLQSRDSPSTMSRKDGEPIPMSWTVGDPGSLDPGELRLMLQGKDGTGSRVRIRAALVNGKEIRDKVFESSRDLPIEPAGDRKDRRASSRATR
jgi:hypothetical protein